jgi:predicted metal-binding transcription factor (methanogenesis marker protein 9)
MNTTAISASTTSPTIDLSAMNAAFAQQLATYFTAAATATATDCHAHSNTAAHSMVDGSAISNVCPFRHAKLTDVHMSVSARCDFKDVHSSDSVHNWRKSIQQLKTQRIHIQQQQQQQQHNVCIRAHGMLLDAATVTTNNSLHSR